MSPESLPRAEHAASRGVAMIDILGFRSLLLSNHLLDVVRRVHELLDDAQNWLTAHISQSRGGFRTRTLGEVHFSDTILIWTPPISDPDGAESEMAIGHLIRAVTLLLWKSILKGVPLRAGIAFGECYMDAKNHVFVGSAIVDAYELESAQDWAGGAVHPTVPFGIPGAGCLKKYAVPFKRGVRVETDIALNWPDVPDSPEAYKSLKRAVYAMLDGTTESSARAKLQNSCSFLEAVYGGVSFMRSAADGGGYFNPTED